MATYTAKDITVLEGLEPVRKRPGMYIGGVGSTGLHHLVWEILDNSVDEAMNGYASNITVTLHEDGASITIADDGRGIPVDKHSKTKTSALEVIFTTLHAGGKFDAASYKTAGGLHGVGASVVNALSKELVATVRRDGAEWEMRFKQGKAVGALKKNGAARGTGSTVFFRPDTTIFPKVEFDADIIKQRLEVSSYLHKGVKIVFEDETKDEKHVFQHTEGLVDYLKTILRERTATPVHDAPFTLSKDGDDTGLRLDLALQWTQSTDEHVRSYVNGIPTGSGGTHENGFRAGLGKAVRNFIETHNLSPEGRDADGRRHPRRPRGGAERLRRRAAVPGADEGSAQQPRGDVGGRLAGASRARALAEHQHHHRRVDRRARDSRRQGARGEPRGAAGSRAQDGHLRPAHAAGQAERLHVSRPRGQRALHRRRGLGRRVGEAGTRSHAARRSCRCAAKC